MPKRVVAEVVLTTTEYLVKDGEGEFRVTLPAGARITFGPAIPGDRMKRNGFEGNHSYALRIYATKKNDSLIAVFNNVFHFRPVTLDVKRLVIREEGKTLWKSDDTGFEVTSKVNRTQVLEDTSRLLNG